MTAEQLISFARGAPSLDIIDVAGLKAAAARAFDADPAGVTAYGTSVGYPPLRAWIADEARRRGRAGAGHQRLAAGRRVPVRLPRRQRRRGGGGAADLRPHPAQPADPRRPGAPGDAAAGRHRHRRAAQAARVRSAAEARAHHSRTTRTRPVSRCPWTSGGPCWSWPAEYGFTIFEDDPYVDIRFRGEALPSMLSLDDTGRRGARQFVHQDGLPRRPGRLPGRPGRADRRDRAAGDQPLHLARHGGAGDRPPVLRLRRHRPIDPYGQCRARRAGPGAGGGAAGAHPRRPVHRA